MKCTCPLSSTFSSSGSASKRSRRYSSVIWLTRIDRAARPELRDVSSRAGSPLVATYLQDSIVGTTSEGRQLKPDDRLLSLWRIGHLSHVRNILGQQRPGQREFQVILNTLSIPVPDASRELGYLAVMARDIILVRQRAAS